MQMKDIRGSPGRHSETIDPSGVRMHGLDIARKTSCLRQILALADRVAEMNLSDASKGAKIFSMTRGIFARLAAG
jgi:hypothetical protein